MNILERFILENIDNCINYTNCYYDEKSNCICISISKPHAFGFKFNQIINNQVVNCPYDYHTLWIYPNQIVIYSFDLIGMENEDYVYRINPVIYETLKLVLI